MAKQPVRTFEEYVNYKVRTCQPPVDEKYFGSMPFTQGVGVATKNGYIRKPSLVIRERSRELWKQAQEVLKTHYSLPLTFSLL